LSEPGTVSAAGGGAADWPVPDIAIVCGLPMPFEAIVIVPERAPATSGVNCTLIEHDDSGLTNAPGVQVLLTMLNSAGLLLETLEICTAALPIDETFFACTGLPTPTDTVPNANGEGIESWLVTPPPKVAR